MNLKRLGVTLAELIVVLVLAGFLVLCVSTQVFVRMPEMRAREGVTEAKGNFMKASQAINLYKQEKGSFPAPQAMANLPGRTMLPPEIDGQLIPDRFTKKLGGHYRYYIQDDRWALSAPGPDKDDDLAESNIYTGFANPGDLTLLNLAYDPTNGMFSNGDVYLLSETPEKKP